MKWKDLAFWKKVSVASGAVLALLVLSSAISYTGVKGTMKEARRMERLNEANRASGDQQHEANSASTHIILIALLALGAGVSFSLFLARFTTVRISALTPFSDRMAEGDLTGRMDIDQKDEVGMLAFSLQKTQRNLGRIAELPLTRWSASPPSPTPCSMSPGNWPKARRT